MERCKVQWPPPHPEPCGYPAPYTVMRDLEYEGRVYTPVCDEHAAEEVDAGGYVTGPTGHRCVMDRDRLELVEVEE